MCSIESSLKGFIVGVEITIEGYPAPLVYCAHITIKDIDVLRELESLLQKVRIYEEMAVKKLITNWDFSMRARQEECIFCICTGN